MGRPIKKKFFGSDNVNDGLTYTTAGGEGVASIAYTNRGTNYSAGITVTAAVSPIGGTTAVITPVTVFANGAINTATISTAGTGYLTAPALTITKPANVVTTGTTYNPASGIVTVGTTTGLYVGMAANVGFGSYKITAIWTGNSNVLMTGSNTAALSSTPISFGDVGASGALTAVLFTPDVTANTIQGNAWTTNSGLGKVCDILKQEGARLYRVTNANDTNVQCRLVPTGTNGVNSPTVAAVTTAGGPVAVGQMTINATDHLGGTYWVTKLSSRTAVLVQGGTGTPGTFWTNYAKVRWTSTGAATTTTVQIAQNA